MKKISPHLTYAGTLPFIACTILLITQITAIPLLGSVERMITAYGLVIASFMIGAHWGQHLTLTGQWESTLPLISTAHAVLLWIAFILLAPQFFLILLSASFAFLLFIDKKLLQDGLIDREYFRTRYRATLIVIAALIISGIYA